MVGNWSPRKQIKSASKLHNQTQPFYLKSTKTANVLHSNEDYNRKLLLHLTFLGTKGENILSKQVKTPQRELISETSDHKGKHMNLILLYGI